ncbi:Eukaryotic elongation factor 2 kinase [Tetrabaena socialis]|uniref:Eukaryotic elongation factor 2 kinase n=1 Tax=Tetrabaena socialis TaxID=47790 RepID=A0A2J8AIG7_9CHLO|nr:Eukaryotic elongation factor 2 kinase [Tetrabaena socialis]|eukprot:PNH12301.1 Eukaryotic elongation factor 2 kinase [Tetrabaena socialis]
MDGLVSHFDGLRMDGRIDLPTSSITVVSHTHGRERREERGIDRRELQETVKHGRRERANPGRDGKPRWRFTHKGVVYVTDETMRHEITSWRMQDAPDEAPPLHAGGAGGGTSHVVVVVDCSGSMRKDDVPGYPTRTAAVYDCLARNLVEPQLRVGGGGMEVSLIEMSDGATVLLERSPVDQQLMDFLKRRAKSNARYHGNYLPALDAALGLLAGDATRQTQLFLVFLSDGAPSDHNKMACRHGCVVWQPCEGGGMAANGRPKLQTCPAAKRCRYAVRQQVQEQCVQRIKKLGDLLGRDRVYIGTVAFGPPSEEYTVLAAMAAALPRNSFQKLGLSAGCLRTAFTSLTSSLTTMRTDAGGSRPGLTLRTDIGKKGQRQKKQRYDLGLGEMVAEPFTNSPLVENWQRAYPDKMQRGVAHAKLKFGEGEAEELAQLFNRRLQLGPEWQVHFLSCCVYTIKVHKYDRGMTDLLVEQELEGKFTKWNNNAGGVTKAASGGKEALRRGMGAIAEEDEEEDEADVESSARVGVVEHVPQCFSHFTYNVTAGKKLVCDLQGVWNSVDGFTMTDPVIHHGSGTKRNGATDKGPAGMAAFFSTHVCIALCRRLGLPPGPQR